jgi:hypothetical protein
MIKAKAFHHGGHGGFIQNTKDLMNETPNHSSISSLLSKASVSSVSSVVKALIQPGKQQ